MLISELKQTLTSLADSLSLLPAGAYTQPIASLGGATVGQHVRHVIELFQALDGGYETGLLDYDNRKRNVVIQTETDFALRCLETIREGLDRGNKTLALKTLNAAHPIETNYERELLYNLEHCVHHQALLKVAFWELGIRITDETYGVAASTLIYQRQTLNQPA